jgi:hypothetical protein
MAAAQALAAGITAALAREWIHGRPPLSRVGQTAYRMATFALSCPQGVGFMGCGELDQRASGYVSHSNHARSDVPSDPRCAQQPTVL